MRELVPVFTCRVVNLEHVLKALGECGLKRSLCADEDGCLYIWLKKKPSYPTGGEWTLCKPLSEQTQELIDFLYSVFYPDNNNEDE